MADLNSQKQYGLELFLKALAAKPELIPNHQPGEKAAQMLIDGAEKIKEYIYSD